MRCSDDTAGVRMCAAFSQKQKVLSHGADIITLFQIGVFFSVVVGSGFDVVCCAAYRQNCELD